MKFCGLNFLHELTLTTFGCALLLGFGAAGYSQGIGCPSIIGYGDTTVCQQDAAVQLNASPGFTSYSWSPSTGLSDPAIANPMALVSASTAYVVTGESTSANMLVNGDFSLGNTGFVSGLNYMASYSPGNYFTGPGFFDLSLTYDVDHTSTGDNYFMSVDGITTLTPLWESTVAVTPGEDYKFDFWCIRVDAVQPIFEIHFIGDVTGDVVVNTVTAIPYAGVWTWDQYGAPLWNSGSNTSLTIRIVNLELNGYGNDFALDDMTLVGPCYSTDTVYISAGIIPPPPTVVDTTLCSFAGTYLPHASGQNLTWYDSYPGIGNLNATPIDASVSGTHLLWVTQNDGVCESDTAGITVKVVDLPFFDLPDAYTLCEGNTFTLGPDAMTDWTYSWLNGESTTPLSISTAGNYHLQASNNCGTFEDSTLVFLEDCVCYFYVPNAVTPNGDGSNDVFLPLFDCSLENYQLVIFNRWGEVVFETTNAYEGWNTAYNGSGLVQDGVYVWKVQFTETETGNVIRHIGHLVVLK